MGHAVVEKFLDVFAISALGRCRESEELLRLEVIENLSVGRGLCVMEFIDHDDIEVVRSYSRQAIAVEGLNACGDMVPATRLLATNKKFTKVGALEYLPIRALSLLEDLPAVSHKQKARTAPKLCTEVALV